MTLSPLLITFLTCSLFAFTAQAKAQQTKVSSQDNALKQNISESSGESAATITKPEKTNAHNTVVKLTTIVATKIRYITDKTLLQVLAMN